MNNTSINNLNLHFLLLACHTKFHRLYMRELNRRYPDLKLLPGQPKILEYLKNKSAYQRQIADGCLLEPSTLSLILAKMEKAELIKRSKANNNNKNSVVTLTEKGSNVAEIVTSVFKELEEKVQKHCSMPEKNSVIVALRKICDQETLLLSGDVDIDE